MSKIRRNDRNRYFVPKNEIKALDAERNKLERNSSAAFSSHSLEEKARKKRLQNKEFNKRLLAGEIPARRPPVHARTAKKNVKVVSLASVRLADVEE